MDPIESSSYTPKVLSQDEIKPIMRLTPQVRFHGERERVIRELLWAFEDAGFLEVRVQEDRRQSPLERAQERRGLEALAWKRSLVLVVPLFFAHGLSKNGVPKKLVVSVSIMMVSRYHHE